MLQARKNGVTLHLLPLLSPVTATSLQRALPSFPKMPVVEVRLDMYEMYKGTLQLCMIMLLITF